jgi:hypothetical protein
MLFISVSPLYAGSTATSGITAQDIIDRVRRDLNETTAGFWTDTELIQWIDEAVREVVYRTRCLESGVSNIIVIEDTRSYSITSSFLDIEKVEYDMGLSDSTVHKTQIYDLDRVPFSNLRYGHEKERGDPKVFSVWADTLYIWPIPRSDQSGNTLYLYQVPLPSGVTNSSSQIETPSYFDIAILHYVKGRALLKDGQDEGKDYLKLFYDMLNQYIVNIQRREIIQPTE